MKLKKGVYFLEPNNSLIFIKKVEMYSRKNKKMYVVNIEGSNQTTEIVIRSNQLTGFFKIGNL